MFVQQFTIGLNKKLQQLDKDRGIETVLGSHSTVIIEFYNECGLRIRYRIHGHIIFVLHRIPSVLIDEGA